VTSAAIVIRRTYGRPGYRKAGPFHLANGDQTAHLVGYPEYEDSATVKTWCGTALRYGPSERLENRPTRLNISPGGCVADWCRRCFRKRRASS
jgi:hypothetical protein